ncbi:MULTISPECIES: helix-turn-helix transcriptional regulator [unclassified Sphingobium]|uniref:helix-turn-helix transcriptional regulator n=1 Tax=unclassified Sphingobium TaxID=2611147 RepID=UPI0022252101|nr:MULTISPECIES: AlpA family transcriptional regulator [unclassified Sphingobium]MCW2410848.1 prophage regulatory protein [Sphingobium sp. B8D3D]MCW2416862.1 prophage regulatory protein [Sphingobium sp. B8D3A]
MNNIPRLLNIAQVKERTALGKTAIYARIKLGIFPAPVRLSQRCSRWREEEINNWIMGEHGT